MTLLLPSLETSQLSFTPRQQSTSSLLLYSNMCYSLFHSTACCITVSCEFLESKKWVCFTFVSQAPNTAPGMIESMEVNYVRNEDTLFWNFSEGKRGKSVKPRDTRGNQLSQPPLLWPISHLCGVGESGGQLQPSRASDLFAGAEALFPSQSSPRADTTVS